MSQESLSDGHGQRHFQLGRCLAQAVVAGLVVESKLELDWPGLDAVGEPQPGSELDLSFVDGDLLGAQRAQDLRLTGWIGDVDQAGGLLRRRVEAQESWASFRAGSLGSR